MKKYFYIIILWLIIANDLFAQCRKSTVHFTFNKHSYQLVKEPKNWIEAAKCATLSGGYLAEINSEAEQEAIFNFLKHQAGIDLKKTMAPDGGGASYVWLGGNDLAKEGYWIWDGNNDGKGILFWVGGVEGDRVNHQYTNWGHEPDNFNGHQNALGLALTEWPLGLGSLGQAGQWNDLNENNRLFYLIEYDR